MGKWIKRFLEEKGIDEEDFIEITDDQGKFHIMPIECITEFILQMPQKIQDKIKATMAMIDFKNGNIMDYMTHLAKGMILAS